MREIDSRPIVAFCVIFFCGILLLAMDGTILSSDYSRIDTFVIGKNIVIKDQSSRLSYFLSLRTNDVIYLTDIEVDPVIYYDIDIGAHISLDVRTTPILHFKSYRIWSHESKNLK